MINDKDIEVRNRTHHFGGENMSGLKREIVEGLIDFLDDHNALEQKMWLIVHGQTS